jgi:hypothetical protein
MLAKLGTPCGEHTFVPFQERQDLTDFMTGVLRSIRS